MKVDETVIAPPDPQRLVLGAVPPGGRIHSIPGVELLSWLPCLTFHDGEPHAWFIVSSARPRLRCDACRDVSVVDLPQPPTEDT